MVDACILFTLISIHEIIVYQEILTDKIIIFRENGTDLQMKINANLPNVKGQLSEI